jgi:hypothetical protein
MGGSKMLAISQGSWWLTPVILATQETEIRRIKALSQFWQIVGEALSQKHPTQNKADGVAQVVEQLPSKYETLSSNPSTTKKKC